MDFHGQCSLSLNSMKQLPVFRFTLKTLRRYLKSTLTTSSCVLKNLGSSWWHRREMKGAVFKVFFLVSLLGFTVSSNLTPISNVVKISEHFLFLFWKNPWLSRWSQNRCFWGKFIIKITNIFPSSDGRYERRLYFFVHQSTPVS